MAMPNWLASAIYSLLSADTTLAGLVPAAPMMGVVAPSIYFDKAPLEATIPYIVFTLEPGHTINAMNPTAEIEVSTVELTLVASTSEAVSAIEDRLHVVLRTAQPTYPMGKHHVSVNRLSFTGPTKAVVDNVWTMTATYRWAYQDQV